MVLSLGRRIDGHRAEQRRRLDIGRKKPTLMHHQLHDGGWAGEQDELRWPNRRTACCQPAMRLCPGGLHPALTGRDGKRGPAHEAVDHILICEGRFRGEPDMYDRVVALTAWAVDGPKPDIRPSLCAGHFNVACLSGAATLLTLDDFACLARTDAPGSLPVPA